MVSKIKDIRRKLPAARSATKADIARKLGDGLPIASIRDGEMVVEQVVEVEVPQFVAKPLAASSIAAMKVKGQGRTAGASAAGGKVGRKSATAA